MHTKVCLSRLVGQEKESSYGQGNLQIKDAFHLIELTG